MTLPEGYELLHHAEREQPWTLLRQRAAPGGTFKGWARHHEVLYFAFTEQDAADSAWRRHRRSENARSRRSMYRDLRA